MLGLNNGDNRRYDNVNHPAHYTKHPSGVECIQITEHMGFNLGNALKYIWRCDLKKDAIEDLQKAKWYLERELEKRLEQTDKPRHESNDPDTIRFYNRTGEEC